MVIRWIDAGRVSSYRSQAIYHGLGYAQTPETPDTVVMVIPEDPYLCIGYFQDSAKEVDLRFCQERNIPVIRRETGGGTVYIDSGQLFVQWVCQPGFLPRKVEQRFQLFNRALIETYAFFGIRANHYPVNDVHVDGRKIAGTGAATIGQAEVVTGNFLFDFNIEIMTQAFNVPNIEFRNVIRNSLNNYMTWITREIQTPPSLPDVIQAYRSQCEAIFGVPLTDGAFTQAELTAIEKAEEKLKHEDWTHAVKSSPSKNRLVKIHAGVWVGWIAYESEGFAVQVFSQMRNNALEMIRFHLPSHVAPTWSLNKLEIALMSAPLTEAEISQRVAGFFIHLNGKDKLASVGNWTNSVMQIKKEVDKMRGHV